MILTAGELAAAFTEWERRYREEPARFMDEMQKLELSTDSYGDCAAAYFVSILA